MKGVTFAGMSQRAGELLDELMREKLSDAEKAVVGIKRISGDPVTWEFLPVDKRILKAWKKMDRLDIEQGFILKACQGKSKKEYLEVAGEFRLEVI